MSADRRTADRHLAVVRLQSVPLRVLVADDHPLFRRGIARAIERHPALELVGEAGDGQQALALIRALKPDVAVLDVRMPGLSGIEVCAALRADAGAPPTALLMLSAFQDATLVAEARSAGAAGYLGKDASRREVCRAIEAVGRGGSAYLPDGAA